MASKVAYPRKVFGEMRGCFLKQSIKTGNSALESIRDLSSSGESDFFFMRLIAFRKFQNIEKDERRITDMVYCVCSKCGTKLRIEENDTTPGCRDMEEVFCPVCHEEVTTVFTSGIPYAYVEE